MEDTIRMQVVKTKKYLVSVSEEQENKINISIRKFCLIHKVLQYVVQKKQELLDAK